MFLLILANISSGHLVPYPQNVGVKARLSTAQANNCNYLSSRHLFTLKAIVAPTAGITFFIWAIIRAHGLGPIIRQPSQLHGTELAWAMVSSLMSCISNMATLIT